MKPESKESPRILVVDDEPRNRRLMAAILVPEGFTLLEAGSGEEALEVLAEQEVDLVLMDVLMPGIGGVEACKRIRESGDLPVIFVTALVDRESRHAGMRVGANDWLSKPFSEQELIARLCTHLAQGSQSDDNVPHDD